MSHVHRLYEKKLIGPPKWLPNNIHYETIMGSVSYGVSSDTSDMDVYGFCIPPKEILFPHLAGEIPGFGIKTRITPFEQYQQHHIEDKDALGGKGRSYDITIYNIVKYFQLCMENNPNMVDSLFTPRECVLHTTKVGEMVRDNRCIFLHKGAYHKFSGYAKSQLHKMQIKTPQEGSKRATNVEEFGYDTKFAYHLVRLMDEIEQILTLGDLDLQRSKETLKQIRRGEWKEEEFSKYFTEKEAYLRKVYEESKLPYEPDEAKIKTLLLNCLEEHYGSLQGAIVEVDKWEKAVREIQTIIEKVV